MDAEERICGALSTLPCPVYKPPADGTQATYVLIKEALGLYAGHVSNAPTRMKHLYQVHVYSKLTDGTYRTIMDQAIALLRAAGIHVKSYGPDDYETDTTYHHIAITCEWAERLD